MATVKKSKGARAKKDARSKAKPKVDAIPLVETPHANTAPASSRSADVFIAAGDLASGAMESAPPTRQVADKAVAAAKAAKGAAPARDAFGSRVGSDAAKLNAMLRAEPKKMQQLMKEAGLIRTFYNHVNKLVACGKVIKSELGYSVSNVES